MRISFCMCANGGQLTNDTTKIQKLINYRQRHFGQRYDEIKHLFIEEDGKITAKIVQTALNRAQKIHDLQQAKGIKSAESRGYEIRKTVSVQPSEVKRSEAKSR